MNARARFVLPVLLLLSGFCGISYEILYAKLLGNLLGNQFTITASVLLTFLLGIGIGTLYAHHLVRWLWLIEAGIGLYAALMVLAYPVIDRLLYAWVPALGTSILVCAAVSVVLLTTPAFLVGCSVPLFAAYLGTIRESHVFSLTYAIYNIGAGLTALAMEFLLLRTMGLRAATLLLASLNLLVAMGLVLLRSRGELRPVVHRDSLRFGWRVLSAVGLASIASAIFQLLMIKISECLIGPFNETFALVLAVVLMGLALGSWLAMRFELTFAGALLMALVGLGLLVGLLPVWVGAYAWLHPAAVGTHETLALLKFALVFTLMGCPAIGFGATVPTLLRAYQDVARESGQLLFVSSMGNVAGFVLMAFFLHQILDYGPLILLIALMTLGALLLHTGLRGSRAIAAVVLAVLTLGANRFSWNEHLLYFGHREFHSTKNYERAREQRFAADQFKGRHDLFAIIYRDDRPFFFINGYISIALTAASEKIVGAISTMFSPRTDKALVLGIGSGATAGTVGLLFDHTDAVEINATILKNLHRMSEYNFRIEHQPTVRLIHDDGIHFIKTTSEKYSLILNTVTSPLYFSSAKLYTREFYEAVVDRLEPDGVYTTWIDQGLGDRGVDIILNTLESTFEECWLTYVKSSYYLMVCSNRELGLHQFDRVSENDILRDYLAARHGIPIEFIPYEILSDDTFRFVGQETPINTLDHPVLEHEMARLDSETRLFRFTDRLIERSNLSQVARRLEPWLEWDAGKFGVWAELRLADASLLAGALRQVVERQFGDLQSEYARAALTAAELTDRAEAFERLGRRLYDRELFEPAVALFSGALERDATLDRSLYYRGRCYERRGANERAARDFEKVLQLKPDDEDAQEALMRVTDGVAPG